MTTYHLHFTNNTWFVVIKDYLIPKLEIIVYVTD